MAFALLVAFDLSLALALFAVVSFLDVVPTGGGLATFGNLAAGLFVLAWLAAMTTRGQGVGDLFSAHPLLGYVLIVFLAWAAVGMLFAQDPAAAQEGVRAYALNVILLVIAFTAVRTRGQAIRVAGALLIGAVIAAGFGILSPPAAQTDFDEVGRLAGGSLGPNELAATLVAAMALAFAFLAGWRRKPIVRLLALGAAVFCMAGVLLSLSRGGLIALGVALLAAALFGGPRRMAAVALLVAVGLGAVAYFGYVASEGARERITEANTSGNGRSDIWAVGWRMVEDKPVTGVGVGNFPGSSVHYLLEPGAVLRDEFIVDEPKVAHNIYLEVLAEMGVPGLALLLFILGTALTCAWRAARAFARVGDFEMEMLSRGVLVGLCALLVANFFISDQFSKVLWLLLALGPSLLAISATEEARREATA